MVAKEPGDTSIPVLCLKDIEGIVGAFEMVGISFPVQFVNMLKGFVVTSQVQYMISQL